MIRTGRLEIGMLTHEVASRILYAVADDMDNYGVFLHRPLALVVTEQTDTGFKLSDGRLGEVRVKHTYANGSYSATLMTLGFDLRDPQFARTDQANPYDQGLSWNLAQLLIDWSLIARFMTATIEENISDTHYVDSIIPGRVRIETSQGDIHMVEFTALIRPRTATYQ